MALPGRARSSACKLQSTTEKVICQEPEACWSSSTEEAEESQGKKGSGCLVNPGCLLYEAVCSKFFASLQGSGYQLDLSYNLALAHHSSRTPRTEEALDPVSRTTGYGNHGCEAYRRIEKATDFALTVPFLPQENIINFLLPYSEYFDLTADALAENAHLTYKFFTPCLYDFLDAVIMCQAIPEEAFI
ncbi:Tetratricopeptide repeat protein 30A [Fukomys damarensis]|uniref:Tetratricopeptide repeat protein 30 n=1 Tax=Fukomys damarensis TaxID=885580 RepID=A0A091CWA8_FUKDA|nr:Tetratricopeptide repeat protein 30A [Fukomys damarensis]